LDIGLVVVAVPDCLLGKTEVFGDLPPGAAAIPRGYNGVAKGAVRELSLFVAGLDARDTWEASCVA
jgi:hypothetical protein